MAFRLFKDDPDDPPRREVSFADLDNKAFWCQLGRKKEDAFVAHMEQVQSGCEVCIHPEKDDNPYYPDLLVRQDGQLLDGEVKIKNSPLFYGKKYGIDPQYALTMDLKDSFNYNNLLKEGKDLMIFAWVKWEAHEMVTEYRGQKNSYRVKPMHGTWRTWFSRLRKVEESSRPPGIHWYNAHFRRPPQYSPGNRATADWCRSLLEFEPRLRVSGGDVKNISSRGFIEQNGRRYPSGHSSCSYVFDLSDKSIFERLE